jgi:hypothetical protein
VPSGSAIDGAEHGRDGVADDERLASAGYNYFAIGERGAVEPKRGEEPSGLS